MGHRLAFTWTGNAKHGCNRQKPVKVKSYATCLDIDARTGQRAAIAGVSFCIQRDVVIAVLGVEHRDVLSSAQRGVDPAWGADLHRTDFVVAVEVTCSDAPANVVWGKVG